MQFFSGSRRCSLKLVDHPPAEAQRYRFESVEVKEPSFRINGVFLPPDDADSKTVFFAEVQFQKDEDLVTVQGGNERIRVIPILYKDALN